jgi:hypothetical protein
MKSLSILEGSFAKENHLGIKKQIRNTSNYELLKAYSQKGTTSGIKKENKEMNILKDNSNYELHIEYFKISLLMNSILNI